MDDSPLSAFLAFLLVFALGTIGYLYYHDISPSKAFQKSAVTFDECEEKYVRAGQTEKPIELTENQRENCRGLFADRDIINSLVPPPVRIVPTRNSPYSPEIRKKYGLEPTPTKADEGK